jgi:hypothetical protein
MLDSGVLKPHLDGQKRVETNIIQPSH